MSKSSFIMALKKTDLKICTILIILSHLRITHSDHVFGTVTKNVTFFYRKLPVAPSTSSIIEFTISYIQRSVGIKYSRMGIYTAYPKENIDKRCYYTQYGQLRNEDLYSSLGVGNHKRSVCYLSGADKSTVTCQGRVNIQDFMPRNFYLCFGFECGSEPGDSLQGLIYNISFTQQSNETSGCIDYYSIVSDTKPCRTFYKETSLPNLIGNVRINHFQQYFKQFEIYEALAFGDGTCYQHLWEVICYIVLPKCEPVTEQVVHPCREMCWNFVEGCWQKFQDTLQGIDTRFLTDSHKFLLSLSLSDKVQIIDCDYLPSSNGNISCFYKPVTCDSPPDVTNSTRMLNATQKAVYHLHDVVQYTCINETFEVRGNSSTTCLYSGEWSHPPPRCIDYQRNSVHPLYIVLPVLAVSLIIYTSLYFYSWYFKTKSENLARNNHYDAFVCYCYEAQDVDFAEKNVPFQLEEKRGFQLCIHRRDFKAGWDIKWNIMNAIRNSNSAIIIMSQDYINSLWCVEEFEDCYMENMKDPAFKLFVILMQPADKLAVTNEYIKSFFAKKTYLEREDPKLFKKMAEYLTLVKQLKRGKPLLDEAIDDNIDPLLGENGNENENEIADKIVTEEQKQKVGAIKLSNEVEDDSGVIYEESETSSRPIDNDQFLTAPDLEIVGRKQRSP